MPLLHTFTCVGRLSGVDFKDKLDNIIAVCFGQNVGFVKCLKESFENFINQRQNKPAELIGWWCDGERVLVVRWGAMMTQACPHFHVAIISVRCPYCCISGWHS